MRDLDRIKSGEYTVDCLSNLQKLTMNALLSGEPLDVEDDYFILFGFRDGKMVTGEIIGEIIDYEDLDLTDEIAELYKTKSNKELFNLGLIGIKGVKISDVNKIFKEYELKGPGGSVKLVNDKSEDSVYYIYNKLLCVDLIDRFKDNLIINFEDLNKECP